MGNRCSRARDKSSLPPLKDDEKDPAINDPTLSPGLPRTACWFGANCTIADAAAQGFVTAATVKHLATHSHREDPEPPLHNPLVWLTSCRQDDNRSELSGHLNIFQPNLRPPCENYAKCKRQHDREHTRQFQHPRPDTASAGEDAVDEFEHGGTSVTDIKDWSKDTSPSVPTLPSKCHVVVFVHGLAFAAYKMMTALRQLHQQLHLDMRLQNLCIVGFVWNSCELKTAYHSARANTALAAPLLRQLITVLEAHDNTVHLIGHSLGARVVLTALRDATRMQRPVGGVFLLAGAVPADALGLGGEFDVTLLAGCKIIVFYSTNDTVLPTWFTVAEFITEGTKKHATTAIGLTGPADPVIGVKVVDVSDEVNMHWAPAWLGSPTVLWNMITSVLPEVNVQIDQINVPTRQVLEVAEFSAKLYHNKGSRTC